MPRHCANDVDARLRLDQAPRDHPTHAARAAGDEGTIAGDRKEILHATNPSAESTVLSFADVSMNSSSGQEPSMIPAPAKILTLRSSTSPQRIVTTHSPSPVASDQPTSPA